MSIKNGNYKSRWAKSVGKSDKQIMLNADNMSDYEEEMDLELQEAKLEVEDIGSNVKKSFDEKGNIEYKNFAFHDLFEFFQSQFGVVFSQDHTNKFSKRFKTKRD